MICMKNLRFSSRPRAKVRCHRPPGTARAQPWVVSPQKQLTFGDATTGFPTKWRLRNKHRNSVLATCHYPDLGGASDWSRHVGNLIQPITSTTQIWIVKSHQYGISVLVSQTSFGRETTAPNVTCLLRLISSEPIIKLSFCSRVQKLGPFENHK